jgi:hypothetical protein
MLCDIVSRSEHLSVRVPEEVRRRLDETAAGSPGETRSSLALRLIDEGLRMQRHPGIVFRPGPAGRRPAVYGGPDVWEIARLLRDIPRGPRAIERVVELMGLPRHQVETAARYYRDFGVEVDAWIELVDKTASELARLAP